VRGVLLLPLRGVLVPLLALLRAEPEVATSAIFTCQVRTGFQFIVVSKWIWWCPVHSFCNHMRGGGEGRGSHKCHLPLQGVSQ